MKETTRRVINGLILGSILAGCVTIFAFGMHVAFSNKSPSTHVSESLVYNLNCNDCHKGKFFVKILNSADDNTQKTILERAGVK